MSLHRQAIFFCGLFMLLVQGCSNFENSDGAREVSPPPVDTTPPRIDRSYPSEADILLEPDEAVELEFNEEVDTATLLNAIQLYEGLPDEVQGEFFEERAWQASLSTSLSIGQDPVTGEDLEIDSTVATLRHASGRFALNTSYSFVVREIVKDLSPAETIDPVTGLETTGNFMTSEFVLSFSIEDGAWRSANYIDVISADGASSDDEFFDASVSGNLNGQTMAVFRRYRNGVSRLMSSRYLPNQESWVLPSPADEASANTAEVISSSTAEGVLEHDIAINGQGHAVAVWTESPAVGEAAAVWANIFDGEQWLGAQQVSGTTDVLGSVSPQAAINDAGVIMVTWAQAYEERDGSGALLASYQRVKANYMAASIADDVLVPGAWLVEPDIVNDTYQADGVRPSVEELGDAAYIFVWVQEVSGRDHVLSREWRSQAGWQSAQVVNPAATGDASAHHLDMNRDGLGFAVWLQNDGARNNLWVSSYGGGGWKTPQLLERDDRGSAEWPFVAVGEDGQAAVAWVQRTGGGAMELLVRNFTVESSWTPAESLSGQGTGVVQNPQIAFDREGNAMALWLNGTALKKLRVSRFQEDSGWRQSNNSTIESFSTTNESPILQALADDGRMLVLWYQYDGERYRLASNLFSDGG